MSYTDALTRINDLDASLNISAVNYPGAGTNGFKTALQTAVDRFQTSGPALLNNPASAAKTPTNNSAAPTTFNPTSGAYGQGGGGGYGAVSQIGASSAVPAGSGLSPQLNATFDAAASKYGVPANLAKAVGKAESNYRPSAESPAGAQGIMQLMPSTAAGLGVTNSLDAAQSIDGGTKYLGQLLQRFGGNQQLAVAAYNAGPNAISKYNGVPPYPETQNYVTKVLGYANQFGGTSTSSASADGSSTTGSIPTDSDEGALGALRGS